MHFSTVSIIIFVLYLYAIYPNTSRKEKLKPYTDTFIAHRGLFNNINVPENSLLAFKLAVEKGYGIELDTQITKDDKIVVFHDGNLKRMTGVDKMLIDCTYEELQSYRLLDTDERIPLFSDVLKVLTEIKNTVEMITTEKNKRPKYRAVPIIYQKRMQHKPST